jgi:diguanylate cyclase (GGDEF)-like protein
LRQSHSRVRLIDALLFALLLLAFLAATRLESFFAPAIVPFAQTAIFGAVAMLLTASALRRGVARGAHLAYTDELTGLNNRRSFTEAMADHLFDHRSRGQVPALLLLDLDRFKVINDTLGHPAGDDLLKVVAQRLELSAPPGSFVARLGGDEFAIIVQVREANEATMIAEDVLSGLNQPVNVKGHEIWPNASIGIALPGATRVPPGELLSMADVALYQAKGRGKGRAFLFDSNVRLPSVSKLSMESELHMAIKHGQFEMLYQPIVGLRDRRIIGAEALLRWNHPTQGVLTPEHFLALADETGIGHALGRWIVRETSGQSRVWRELFGEQITVSINVSAAQFQSLEFIYSLGRLVRDAGAPINGLNFEVTEATLTSDEGATQTNLAELRRMGFKVAIDDFGVGFSSLNYLQNNRMDILKLDPAFVRSEDSNQRTFRIVHSIVELAHSLGMSVVAEGIETEEQYQRMHQAGCDHGQGYYFARPMPPQDLTDMLANAHFTLPAEVRVERRGSMRPWTRWTGGDDVAWRPDAQEQRGA